jgi:hypothetical protein
MNTKELIEKYEIMLSTVKDVIQKSDLNEDTLTAQACERFLKGFIADLKAFDFPESKESKTLPDQYWFNDENGITVVVIGIIDKWCIVEDFDHEEPYILPLEFVVAIYKESTTPPQDKEKRVVCDHAGTTIAWGPGADKCTKCGLTWDV